MMTKRQSEAVTIIDPPGLALPPGYSNVVCAAGSRMVFIAGQAAYDSEGKLVGAGDFSKQVNQVFFNLKIALSAAQCSVADLVKLTVFLRDMEHLPIYRQARDHFLATVAPPARPAVTLVEVSRLFSDDLLVEIEAINRNSCSSCRPETCPEKPG